MNAVKEEKLVKRKKITVRNHLFYVELSCCSQSKDTFIIVTVLLLQGNMRYNTADSNVVWVKPLNEKEQQKFSDFISSLKVPECCIILSKSNKYAYCPPIFFTGVCDIPSFNEGSTVTCSGILSYTCKSLHTEETQLLLPEAPPPQYQISFEPVKILAHELQNHFVTIEQIAVKGGNNYLFSLRNNRVLFIAYASCNLSDIYCFPSK